METNPKPGKIILMGLGPADIDQTTARARAAIALRSAHRYLNQLNSSVTRYGSAVISRSSHVSPSALNAA